MDVAVRRTGLMVIDCLKNSWNTLVTAAREEGVRCDSYLHLEDFQESQNITIEAKTDFLGDTHKFLATQSLSHAGQQHNVVPDSSREFCFGMSSD